MYVSTHNSKEHQAYSSILWSSSSVPIIVHFLRRESITSIRLLKLFLTSKKLRIFIRFQEKRIESILSLHLISIFSILCKRDSAAKWLLCIYVKSFDLSLIKDYSEANYACLYLSVFSAYFISDYLH